MQTPLFNWLETRGAGVLLHPTCLPGHQGIGTFDVQVDRFLDFLQAAGMSTWQICPLGPTGYGDSPYQCFSAFAGNPYLIDLGELASRGLFKAADLAPITERSSGRVDYGALYRIKWALLKSAFERYQESGSPALETGSFEEFKKAQADWLDPYALFRALKDFHGGRAWTEWPDESRVFAKAMRSPLRKKLAPACEAQRFYQYVFFAQWRRVRREAARRKIAIVGDLPIFVAADSADVWARPELFELDQASGRPVAVAGVPPDYFSADGQLWGNPLYAWERHAADGYAWWISRLRAAFELYDIARIDHFRGFDSYWRIPLPAANARTGAWVAGPGIDLFKAIRRAQPRARIIAEDLGLLTPGVVRFREETGLPGMAVLQFAFGGDESNLYLPRNLLQNQVVYPGTHDNDTSIGWYASAGEAERDHVRRTLSVNGSDIGWDLIRAAYAAPSRLAVITVQDILSLGSEARLNSPGKPEGNWQWRLSEPQMDRLAGGTARYLRELGGQTGRC
jgi:4-alpha-glucanotransferase